MRRMIRRKFNLKSERGAALVEFALVVPFLMLIMCATIDFGLAVYTLANLTAAVREGGRFAASRFPGVAADDIAVQNKVYGYIAGMNNGMTQADIRATIKNTKADALTPDITVSITGYKFKPMTPLMALFGMQTILMNRSSVFRWEGAPG